MPLRDVEAILVVPQFHYDVAYLQTEEQYYPRCFDNFREAIALMEGHPDYRYTIEQPFLVEQFAARCPDDFARLRACFERGQLEVSGALYVIPDMNLPSGESLFRQIRRGRRTVAALFGADVRAAWLADTWGHPATIPAIMRQAGIEGYLFTRGMRPESQHAEVLWRSPDGSELPTHWLPGGYAALRFPEGEELATETELTRLDATEENLLALVARLRPLFSQGTLLCCSGGDFARPQATAPAVVRAWQERGLPVRFGAVADYLAALRRHAADLPLETGEFNPLFIGTQASRIRLKQWNRQLEQALASAERLSAVLGLLGHLEPTRLDQPERLLLKNQFHDTISGTLVDAAFRDAERDYQTAFELVAHETARLGTGLGGVFNPSAFERTEWVVSSDGGSTAPVTVPPLGFAPLPAPLASGEPQPCASTVIENERWRVSVGPSGTITSVIDRATGHEFVDEGGCWGDLVYRNDNGDFWLLDRGPLDGGSIASALTEPQSDDPYVRSPDPLVNDAPVRQHGPRRRLTYAERPGEQQVTVTGALGFWRNRVEFTTTITLHAGDPLLRFETRIIPHGRHYRLYTCFGTPWPDAQARHQVAFGVAERDDRRYVAQDWCEAVGPSGAGVRLLNAGLPGNAVNRGVISLLLFRSAAMEYKGESETGFEDGVPHLFRYAVRPIAGADGAEAWREGERLNRPLVRFGIGDPPRGPAVALDSDQVVLTALYRLANGDYLVRLHEATGQAVETTLRLGELSAAWASDAMETRGEPVPLVEGKLPVRLGPWAIASWLVRC